MICWVAGGAGFIGTHLCEALAARGDTVVCLDNLSSGEFTSRPNQTNHFWDVCDSLEESTIVDPPDVIFHLASLASPADYLRDPVGAIRANTEGTKQLLDLAKKYEAHLVYTSTSEIYGDPKETPQREGLSGELDPESPRAPYYASKGVGEALCYAYKQRGQEVSVLRLFNTYGPGMRLNDGRCVPTFIAAALRNDPIPMHGNGSQTRSLCYVDDTVEAIVKVGDLEKSLQGPVNIGNDFEVSIFLLAKLITTLTKSDSEVVSTERLADDPNRRCPEISKAQALLDWVPKITLKDGLLRTIESYYGKTNFI